MNFIKAWFKAIAIPNYRKMEASQKEQIYSGFRHYDLTPKQVKVYALLDLNSEYMSIAKKGLASGVSCKDIKICLDMQLSRWRFERVIKGILMGFSKQQILSYANASNENEAFIIYTKLVSSSKKN